jgi:hypothetical protein
MLFTFGNDFENFLSLNSKKIQLLKFNKSLINFTFQEKKPLIT